MTLDELKKYCIIVIIMQPWTQEKKELYSKAFQEAFREARRDYLASKSKKTSNVKLTISSKRDTKKD